MADEYGMFTVGDQAIAGLQESGFRGELIRPGDPGYATHRAVWNGTIDRHPALIARCTGTADVITALLFGREQGIDIAVRGGMHSIPGFSSCDGGIVIDLTPMKGVRVDALARRARAAAGATWGEYDHETQLFGLASTGGVVSTTGVAGLTLGGGIGWLTRRCGLACDNLVSADVVLADGEVVHASDHDDADLFWGLRGGGGNFGIVTSFEFHVHPIGPTVLCGLVGHPAERAPDVLRFYREFAAEAPPELGLNAVFMTVPPLPAIPEELHGHAALAVAALWPGGFDEGERVVAPIREFGPPVIDLLQPMPYVTFQAMMDPLFPHGTRGYMKSGYLSEISDDAIDVLCEHAAAKVSDGSMVEVITLGGAMAEVGEHETAFAHRDSAFAYNIVAGWDAPVGDDANIEWAREFGAALAPLASDGVYVNFLTETGDAAARSAYDDERWAQLTSLKAKYDPDNVFRLNQNVPPVAS